MAALDKTYRDSVGRLGVEPTLALGPTRFTQVPPDPTQSVRHEHFTDDVFNIDKYGDVIVTRLAVDVHYPRNLRLINSGLASAHSATGSTAITAGNAKTGFSILPEGMNFSVMQLPANQGWLAHPVAPAAAHYKALARGSGRFDFFEDPENFAPPYAYLDVQVSLPATWCTSESNEFASPWTPGVVQPLVSADAFAHYTAALTPGAPVVVAVESFEAQPHISTGGFIWIHIWFDRAVKLHTDITKEQLRHPVGDLWIMPDALNMLRVYVGHVSNDPFEVTVLADSILSVADNTPMDETTTAITFLGAPAVSYDRPTSMVHRGAGAANPQPANGDLHIARQDHYQDEDDTTRHAYQTQVARTASKEAVAGDELRYSHEEHSGEIPSGSGAFTRKESSQRARSPLNHDWNPTPGNYPTLIPSTITNYNSEAVSLTSATLADGYGIELDPLTDSQGNSVFLAQLHDGRVVRLANWEGTYGNRAIGRTMLYRRTPLAVYNPTDTELQDDIDAGGLWTIDGQALFSPERNNIRTGSTEYQDFSLPLAQLDIAGETCHVLTDSTSAVMRDTDGPKPLPVHPFETVGRISSNYGFYQENAGVGHTYGSVRVRESFKINFSELTTDSRWPDDFVGTGQAWAAQRIWAENAIEFDSVLEYLEKVLDGTMDILDPQDPGFLGYDDPDVYLYGLYVNCFEGECTTILGPATVDVDVQLNRVRPDKQEVHGMRSDGDLGVLEYPVEVADSTTVTLAIPDDGYPTSGDFLSDFDSDIQWAIERVYYEWAEFDSYSPGDRVWTNDNEIFVWEALTSHTASQANRPESDGSGTADWKLYTLGNMPPWRTGLAWENGAWVRHGGGAWVSTSAHTSTAENAPGEDGAPWIKNVKAPVDLSCYADITLTESQKKYRYPSKYVLSIDISNVPWWETDGAYLDGGANLTLEQTSLPLPFTTTSRDRCTPAGYYDGWTWVPENGNSFGPWLVGGDGAGLVGGDGVGLTTAPEIPT